jgi:hypothetical protein
LRHIKLTGSLALTPSLALSTTCPKSAARREELLTWDLHCTYHQPVCTTTIEPKWKTMAIVVNDDSGSISDLAVVEECEEADKGGDNECTSFGVFVSGALNLQVSQGRSKEWEQEKQD